MRSHCSGRGKATAATGVRRWGATGARGPPRGSRRVTVGRRRWRRRKVLEPVRVDSRAVGLQRGLRRDAVPWTFWRRACSILRRRRSGRPWTRRWLCRRPLSTGHNSRVRECGRIGKPSWLTTKRVVSRFNASSWGRARAWPRWGKLRRWFGHLTNWRRCKSTL